ncbi:MAG: hypothetical protein K2Q25_11005 [Mycobacteriaceae bacterium]|nr:hypothetical protein [Mycobacteriaceae bacterium]
MSENWEPISSATYAVTSSAQQASVADWSASSGGQRPERSSAGKTRTIFGGWFATAVALVVAVLLGVGIGYGLWGTTTSLLSVRSDPGAQPDGVKPTVLTPPRQLQSLGGLTGLMDQTRKKFGNTVGLRLVIYPDYAVLDRQDPSNNRRQLSYTYRGGWGDPTGSAITGHEDRSGPVDLGAFDAKAAVGILRGAPQTLGIQQSEVKSTYMIVEPATDPTTPGAVSLSVYVSSDYGSGYIVFAGDGTVKQVNQPS